MTTFTELLAQDALGIDAYADAVESALMQDDYDGLVENGPSADDEAFYTGMILSGILDAENDSLDAWAEDTFDPDLEPWQRGTDSLAAFEREFYGY
jgi:hypothetical protein